MLELATGSGLALAAGLNAWIPLLALGLLSRYTDLVTLPGGWAWLENGWILAMLVVMLVRARRRRRSQGPPDVVSRT
jgi:hypothetical protein